MASATKELLPLWATTCLARESPQNPTDGQDPQKRCNAARHAPRRQRHPDRCPWQVLIVSCSSETLRGIPRSASRQRVLQLQSLDSPTLSPRNSRSLLLSSACQNYQVGDDFATLRVNDVDESLGDPSCAIDRFRSNTLPPSLPRKNMLRNFVAFFF